MQVSATRVSVGCRRARGGDVVDPCREAARRGGRGGACCGDHGADDQDGVDGAALDGERVEQCADGAAASRTTAPGSEAQEQASRRLGHGCRARGRDGGWILVTVVSTVCLPVVAEMSRARWPSSPSARSCSCLHRGSNAQAVSKTGEAARSHARADGQRKWRRAEAGAESAESGRRGSGHRTRAASCARACSMRTGLARAAAGPTEAAPHTWRPAGLVGTPVDGGLVSLGCEEVGDDVDHGVDRLARILVPRGASIVMCALGGWCACGVECGGAIVLILRGGWAKRAELGAEIAPRIEAEIEPRTA
jgi:hypothetical protein